MRMFKFRAWRFVEKEMIYSADSLYEFHFGDSFQGIVKYTKRPYEFILASHVKLMLCLGRKDKNGKEMYGGDILKWRLSTMGKGDYFHGVVEFHDRIIEIGWEHDETRFIGYIMKYCPKNEKEYYREFPYNTESIEIVGNIYENPGLLKEVI